MAVRVGPTSTLTLVRRRSPSNHTTVYLVGGTVVRSTDAGANWVILDTKLPCNDFIKDLVLDLKNPSTLYAIAGTRVGNNINYYVIKSTDSGNSWATLTWAAALGTRPEQACLLAKLWERLSSIPRPRLRCSSRSVTLYTRARMAAGSGAPSISASQQRMLKW